MSIVSTDEAVELLNKFEVVALPTETVYGLAGRCDQPSSLEKIFSVKKRPFFDPLILHVSSIKQAEDYGKIDQATKQLMQHFWPGPLTFVVTKSTKVLSLVNNGGETVALRMPAHPDFQEVLKQIPAPLAAPSANLFGQTSPTTAQHVTGEFSNDVPVVDGGACEKGIESTVVQVLPESNKVLILRPGVIAKDDLISALSQVNLKYKVEYQSKEISPGFLKNHYQPSSPLFFIKSDSMNTEIQTLMETATGGAVQAWNLPDDSALAARHLYADLREFSKNNDARYILIPKTWQSSSLKHALIDRLLKASHGIIEKNTQGQWVLINKN